MGRKLRVGKNRRVEPRMKIIRDSIPLLAEVGQAYLPNLDDILQDVEESRLLDAACIEGPSEEDTMHKTLFMGELSVEVLEGMAICFEGVEGLHGGSLPYREAIQTHYPIG